MADLWRAGQMETCWKPPGEILVLDVIYLCLGLGLLGLMALYAYACDRL